jgi:glycosyltransferase involved in cell wall biosynthesis
MNSRVEPPLCLAAQLAAREYYTIPYVLERAGRLERFYTDLWAGKLRPLYLKGNAGLRRLAERYHPHLPAAKVNHYTRSFFWRSYRKAFTKPNLYDRYTAIGEWFGERVVADLKRRPVQADHFVSFSTGCLEILRHLQPVGVRSLVDQLDPGRVEDRIVQEEGKKWPGWAGTDIEVPESYYERINEELRLADRILVNSEWSKRCHVQNGVDAGKIHVVPLSFDAKWLDGGTVHRQRKDRLRVLWLGGVSLRQGIPYLIEAAKLLLGRPVDFRVVGELLISEAGQKSAPENLVFLGKRSRAEAIQEFREADVFILPTMSDGFALTQLEAMSFGLPVIATDRCGDVVTDGVDGWKLEAGVPAAIVQAIESCLQDRPRLEAMSEAALKKAGQFTVDRYQENLIGLLDGMGRRQERRGESNARG